MTHEKELKPGTGAWQKSM